MFVYLSKDGKDVGYAIHRLVATAFIKNLDNKPEVDHLNCVRDDNRAENLFWVTHKENCNNPITIKNYSVSSTGRKCVVSEERIRKLKETIRSRPNPLKGIPRSSVVRAKIAKAHYKKVIQLSLDGEFIKEWESIQLAAEGTGMSRDRIGKIAKGEGKKHRKYLWKFA